MGHFPRDTQTDSQTHSQTHRLTDSQTHGKVFLQSCIAAAKKSLLDIFSTLSLTNGLTNQLTNGQTQKTGLPFGWAEKEKKTVNHGHPKRYYILGVKKSLAFFDKNFFFLIFFFFS